MTTSNPLAFAATHIAPPVNVRLDQWSRQPGEATRILLIDDHRPSVTALAVALECEGYDTRFQCSGLEGVAWANTWLPHVVLLDADMPEWDGFATASMIRRIVPNPDLVIIAYTGLCHAHLEEQALAAGFDAYCQKGCAMSHLLSTIETLVDRPF